MGQIKIPRARLPSQDVTPHVYRPTCRYLCGGARTFPNPLRAIRRQRSDRPGFAATSSMCRQRFVAACSWPCAFHLDRPYRCPRRFCARMMSCLFCADPERGVGGAPGGAHWSSRHACEARQPRWRNAAHPVATGTAPLGAPPWRFSAAGPRVTCPTVPPDHAATSPAGPQGLAGRIPQPPGRGCTAVPGRHAPLRLQDVSGDAPHERGCESCSTTTLRSQ